MDGVPLVAIAASAGTPAYVYSAPTIRRRARALRDALGPAVAIHYAVKANDRLAILALMRDLGLGLDVVSGGEIRRALRAGFAPDRIVFSGTGKTDDELRLALDSGIGQINVESAAEIERLAALADGRRVRVALRVNPDIDAGTHAKIATGRAADKFGIPHADIPPLYARAAALGLAPVGLAVHIGSQVARMAPFRAAFARLRDLTLRIRATGQTVDLIDCGGGLGLGTPDDGAPTPAAYAGAIRAELGDLGVRLAVEPGRFLAGPTGILLASLVLEKRQGETSVTVLDAAMNDLIRPALYGARHPIVPVAAADAARPATPTDIVGPVCETGDIFARAEKLPSLAPGALVAILDAGAYGAVMASPYNARRTPAEILVDDGWRVIRRRPSVADLWRDETV